MLTSFLNDPFQIAKSINRFLNQAFISFVMLYPVTLPTQQKLAWKAYLIDHCSSSDGGLFSGIQLQMSKRGKFIQKWGENQSKIL